MEQKCLSECYDVAFWVCFENVSIQLCTFLNKCDSLVFCYILDFFGEKEQYQMQCKCKVNALQCNLYVFLSL